ncbi:hypothetical protein D9C73_009597 [Collichthys lucidus]|uniref:Uncharacterized protein n=1 Tax=Collichthys lucidus TaxID=240159 RepID=A0A4U5UPC3_COLLU|nr:hypothetical protein D9C73_009597 [Collichthys lucidus]
MTSSNSSKDGVKNKSVISSLNDTGGDALPSSSPYAPKLYYGVNNADKVEAYNAGKLMSMQMTGGRDRDKRREIKAKRQ